MTKGRFERLVKGLAFAAIALALMPSSSCTNDVIVVDPLDSTMLPCSPQTVYFELQILPMLKGNCSIVGCHDVVTAQSGVILDSYENLINTTLVTPFNLDETLIYQKITEDDPALRMPRFPRDPLDSDQISLVAEWILQGAENLYCDADTVCSMATVSYSMEIAPLIKRSCNGCHSGPNPIGGFSLDEYAQVEEKATAGELYGALAWLPGYTSMPLSQSQLPDCDLNLVKLWVDNGAPDN